MQRTLLLLKRTGASSSRNVRIRAKRPGNFVIGRVSPSSRTGVVVLRFFSTTPRKIRTNEEVGTGADLEELVVASTSHRRDGDDGRRVGSLRRQAASSIPYWLSHDPVWRERTIRILSDSSTTNSHQEYRQLYYDSLPSFKELLESSEDDDDDDAPTTAGLWRRLRPALDRLVGAGFGGPEFSNKFRKMKVYQIRHDQAANSVHEKQRELRAQLITLEGTKTELEKLKRLYRALPPPPPPPPSSSPSMMERALGVLQNLIKTEEQQKEDTRLEQSLRNKRTNLEKKMDKKRRIIDNHARSIDGLKSRLAKLKHQQQAFQPPVSPDDYERSIAAVGQVMPDICEVFASHIHERHSQMIDQYKSLDATTDLTKPYEWYLHARLDKRKIIFHGGPTNSGKTYSALQRLKQVKRGAYLGPLRLLAAEVYEKLTAEGVYCNLYTGQERREIPFATHSAATIEMASLLNDYDCVVIDEIQMIADQERGFAWTRALLGSRCKEIHVCGGLEAKDLIERIAAACGDDFELRTYKRFADLKVAQRSLASHSDQVGSYRAVQRGDCVVAFSRNDIFAIKREIEKTTSHKCCVIYGSLPPQTRSEQARLFNDPNSPYSVLVASDAIGMGLNLNIKRIIFNSMYKNDGSGIAQLNHSAVKQIGGRAGRRNSPYPMGEVTCRDPTDMPHLQKCMKTDIELIPRAGLLPTASHIELFSNALEHYGIGTAGKHKQLHNVLLQFNDIATVKSDFFLCRQTPMVVIARLLAHLDLSIRDKYTLCMCPVATSSRKSLDVLLRFSRKMAAGEVSGLPNNLRPRRPTSFDDLARLCWIYNDLELFLWLQNKFPPGNMMETQAALATRELTIDMIGSGLSMTDRLKLDHCYIKRDQRIRGAWQKNKSSSREEAGLDREDGSDDWNKGTVDML